MTKPQMARGLEGCLWLLLGNTLVVTLYLSIGRGYSAELHVVIDWVVARSGWITLTLVPLIGLIITVAVRRAAVRTRDPCPTLGQAKGFCPAQLFERVHQRAHPRGTARGPDRPREARH